MSSTSNIDNAARLGSLIDALVADGVEKTADALLVAIEARPNHPVSRVVLADKDPRGRIERCLVLMNAETIDDLPEAAAGLLVLLAHGEKAAKRYVRRRRAKTH